MRSITVPAPSRRAYRYYHTLVFHGYFRAFVTGCLLLTGLWMLLWPQPDAATRTTVRGLHVAFGLFGLYLTGFHIVGYFACHVMRLPHVQGAKSHMADTGLVLAVLTAVSAGSGLTLFLAGDLAASTRRTLIQVHVLAAMVYVVMAGVHFYYYWFHWKPALRPGQNPGERSSSAPPSAPPAGPKS